LRARLEELLRDLRPFFPAAIKQRLFLVLRPVRAIPRAVAPDALAHSFERLVPITQKSSLDRPHVPAGKPPVIGSQPAQIEHRVSGQTSGEVDVRIEIAHGERACGTEHRLSSVQAWITRARHGPPSTAFKVYEDDVIEVINRFEAHDERRKSVLLQDAGGGQGRLEAVRRPVPQNLPKTSERFGVRLRFGVVGQLVEKTLHQDRGAQPPNQAPLRRRKGGEGRWRMVHAFLSAAAKQPIRSMRRSISVQPPPKNIASLSLN